MLDLIQWRARKTPEAPALFFNGRWYTYRELEGRANRLANRRTDRTANFHTDCRTNHSANRRAK